MKPKLSAAKKPPRKTKVKGRPVRRDNPQRITLYLALATKRKAYDIAVARRCSISRLVEELLDGCSLDGRPVKTCMKREEPSAIGKRMRQKSLGKNLDSALHEQQ